MTIQTKRKDVLSFYQTFIEGYILEDLKILKLIQPNSLTSLGGCTIPTAMTVISSIELLGFLLNKNGKTGESKINISYLINFENLFPKYYDDNSVEKIYIYRHGMMHHFFPQFKGQFAGICKNENETSLFIIHSDNGQKEESLNVTVFVNDFLQAVEKLKVFLENTNDEVIYDSILDGLKNLNYYFQMPTTITTITTINPGTPKNK